MFPIFFIFFLITLFQFRFVCKFVCRDTVARIAIRYELDGPGIESLWWRIFLMRLERRWGSTQPPVKWVPGLFPRGKAAKGRVDHSPHLDLGLRRLEL